MIPQDAIKTVIQQQGWKRLLLAVSGGLDSICLAHFFVSNKDVLGIEWIGIAHVHHGLREGTADRDAEFVQNFADKFKCNFYLKKLDGVALKNANGSLEENARVVRYEALRQFAAENCADAILTAHHAGDQAETVYLRLRRGVSLAGLRGIQFVNVPQPRSGTGTVALFRPFLNVTREELAKYASQNNLQWCEDETNSDVKFARNQIRHVSLPHLEKMVPRASQQLSKVASFAQNVYIKVLSQAENAFTPAIVPPHKCPGSEEFSQYGKVLAIDLKKVPSNLLYSEMFRLWLVTKGFRLAVNQSKACLPHPLPRHFRHKQFILEKRRNILWFCDLTSIKDTDNLYLVSDK